MKRVSFKIKNVRFERRYSEKGETPLKATTLYALCPDECEGCSAPYYTKLQMMAALSGLRAGINTRQGRELFRLAGVWEGHQNEVAVNCPYFVAHHYI
jgi:hypothetical protein